MLNEHMIEAYHIFECFGKSSFVEFIGKVKRRFYQYRDFHGVF